MTRWRADGWLEGTSWLASPNFGERPPDTDVSLVVVHNISLPPGEFGGHWVENFFLNRLDPAAHPYFASISAMQVSAHFYIRRNGHTLQFVGCDKRAWHAGQSRWQGQDNCNDFSIGIELEGSDEQAFESMQYQALGSLIEALRSRYPITGICGHSDIAPGRKTDPGPFFDWSGLQADYPEFEFPL